MPDEKNLKFAQMEAEDAIKRMKTGKHLDFALMHLQSSIRRLVDGSVLVEVSFEPKADKVMAIVSLRRPQVKPAFSIRDATEFLKGASTGGSSTLMFDDEDSAKEAVKILHQTKGLKARITK